MAEQENHRRILRSTREASSHTRSVHVNNIASVPSSSSHSCSPRSNVMSRSDRLRQRIERLERACVAAGYMCDPQMKHKDLKCNPLMNSYLEDCVTYFPATKASPTGPDELRSTSGNLQ